MRKMKRAKRWTGVLLAGIIGAGACVSGAAVTGVTTAVTAYAAGDVAINATNFPDENFRNYVSEKIDTNSDGKLSESEIAACEEINFSMWGISSLKGIEFFTALKVLQCSSKDLSSLDISKNVALTELYCDSNNLSSLDVSKNQALTTLHCSHNNLCSLDLSKNMNLSGVADDYQKKDVTAVNGEVLLSDLSPDIVASNITNLKGATLSDNKMTKIKWKTITYDYKTGYGDKTMSVTLKLQNEDLDLPEEEPKFSADMLKSVKFDKAAYDPGETAYVTAELTDPSVDIKTFYIGYGREVDEFGGNGRFESLYFSTCVTVKLTRTDEGKYTGSFVVPALSYTDNTGIYLGIAKTDNDFSYGDFNQDLKDKGEWLGVNKAKSEYTDVLISFLEIDSPLFKENEGVNYLPDVPDDYDSVIGYPEGYKTVNDIDFEIVCTDSDKLPVKYSDSGSFKGHLKIGNSYVVKIKKQPENYIFNDFSFMVKDDGSLEVIQDGGNSVTNTDFYIITTHAWTAEEENLKLLQVKAKEKQTNVTIDKKNLVLDKGKTAKLTATVTPADAKDKTVTWSSSNTKVATVDSSGNVKGISQGKAKITAKTVNGKTATCDVRVLFSDVTNPKDWYYTPVYWAADNGITTGAGGKFAPTGFSTREQTVTFIWRMWGSPEPKNLNSKFSDVQNKRSYSYKAIMWANENGVVTGANGKFAPGRPCTREQIVTILWRLAGKPEPKTKTSPFKDVRNPKSYSYKAILWAAEKGITTGANGKFAPANKCLRREMVTFLYRYNKLYKII